MARTKEGSSPGTQLLGTMSGVRRTGAAAARRLAAWHSSRCLTPRLTHIPHPTHTHRMHDTHGQRILKQLFCSRTILDPHPTPRTHRMHDTHGRSCLLRRTAASHAASTCARSEHCTSPPPPSAPPAEGGGAVPDEMTVPNSWMVKPPGGP